MSLKQSSTKFQTRLSRILLRFLGQLYLINTGTRHPLHTALWGHPVLMNVWFWIVGTTVAKGDSGGGLVFKNKDTYFIRGIVSTGVPSQRTYSAFTNVASYIDWMTSIRSEVDNRHASENSYGGRRRRLSISDHSKKWSFAVPNWYHFTSFFWGGWILELRHYFIATTCLSRQLLIHYFV